MGRYLSPVSYTHLDVYKRQLDCRDRNIRNVIVCHNALKQEQRYPCVDGTAYVAVYSEDACILFEDEKRRRFATTVDYTLEPLIEEKESARRCVELGLADTGLELYCCRERAWQMDVNGKTLECYRQAAENPDFTESYRRQVRKKLLDYYVQHRDEKKLSEYLLQMDFQQYARVDKVSVAVILIERGMYDDAFQVISEFGYEGIPVPQLLKLASRMILKRDFEEDEELTCLTDVYKRQVFGHTLSAADKNALATLIYYPKEKMDLVAKKEKHMDDWYRITLYRLIEIGKTVASKYTRSKVRKALPKDFAYVIEELITEKSEVLDKEAYYNAVSYTHLDVYKRQEEKFMKCCCRTAIRLT